MALLALEKVKNKMYLILLGAPGAGKGTQAAFVSKEFGLAHIASGDLFRKNLLLGTELGLLAKTYMDKGSLVPNNITIDMILERIAEPDCAIGFALDGFPRNIEQAEALDKALAKQGKGINKVLYIKGYVKIARLLIMKLMNLPR